MTIRIVICSFAIVARCGGLDTVITFNIQCTFVTNHCTAGLGQVTLDGQCATVQIHRAAGYVHSAMGQQGVAVEIQRTAAYGDITIGLNIGVQGVIAIDDEIGMEPGLLVHLVQISLAVRGADGGSDGLQAGVRHYGGGKDAQDVIIVRHGFLLVMLQIVADRVFQVVHTGDDPLIVRVGYTGPDLVKGAVAVVRLDEFLIAVGAFQEQLIEHGTSGDELPRVAGGGAGVENVRVGQHPAFQQRLQLKQRVQLVIVLHGLVGVEQRRAGQLTNCLRGFDGQAIGSGLFDNELLQFFCQELIQFLGTRLPDQATDNLFFGQTSICKRSHLFKRITECGNIAVGTRAAHIGNDRCCIT